MKVKADYKNFQLLAILFLGLVIFWAILFSYSIHGALPYNPIKLPFEKKIQINVLLTQGWKFFTRSAREERFKVFVKETSNNWRDSSAKVNADYTNFFGLRRKTRSQNIELGLILNNVDKNKWQNCEERIDFCFSKSQSKIDVRNLTPNPSICGEIVIALQEPIPWA